MWISEFSVKNIKTFADSGLINLSKGINVVVGKNNAGKSTLIQSILSIQSSGQFPPFTQAREARRIGTTSSTINIHLQDIQAAYFDVGGITDGGQGDITVTIDSDILPRTFRFVTSSSSPDIRLISNQEPNNFILPYTLKRLAQGFSPLTGNNLPMPKNVLESLNQLADKIQPYTQSSHPLHKRFESLCRSFIGSPMGVIEGQSGHVPGIYAGNGIIPLSQMGDGVPHIVGLIIHLLNAGKKLFVIEELENSINPEPLKLLLEEIKRSAKEQQNQFLISTHSNIVLQYLASDEDCGIIEVTQAQIGPGEIPTSSCTQIVRDDIEARRRVLINLGYSLADSDMFDGWLILEEASAETIIRKFLIPHFAPKLINVLGIIATKGFDQIENQVMALEQNFLYLHLTPAYKNRIWAIIDGGEGEKQRIEHLRQKFKGWSTDHFDQFNEHDFEEYYPSYFHDEVKKILNLQDNSKEAKNKKRIAKFDLLKKVIIWSNENLEQAKREFESSAQEVIDKLKNIERNLNI